MDKGRITHQEWVDKLQDGDALTFHKFNLTGIDDLVQIAEDNELAQAIALSLQQPETCDDTLLVLATLQHDDSEVRRLIDAGANFNSINKECNTALIFAAFHGNIEIVKRLLAKGAKVNDGNSEKETALFFAAARSYKDIFKLLLKHDALWSLTNVQSQIALYYAKALGLKKIL